LSVLFKNDTERVLNTLIALFKTIKDEKWGLGVQRIREFNSTLLGKWCWGKGVG